MHPASLKTSSLSTLLLFLFCSGLQADNWQPLNSVKVNVTTCNAMIQEIKKLLEKPEPLPLNSVNGQDQWLLVNASRRLNLCAFLNAAKNFTDKEKIKSSLEFLVQCLPKVEPTVTTKRSIFIIKGNWNDFWKKLQYYLRILDRELDSALKARIPYPTSSSVPGSSQHGTLGC